MLDNPAFNPAALEGGEVQPLTEDEIKAFIDDLDHNGDGYIDYSEVERKLDAVHDEIQPSALPDAHAKGQSLHHDTKDDRERHAFLRAVIGSDEKRIHRDAFAARVREWRIPSLKQEKEEEESQDEYMRRIGWVRRTRSYWAVHGPTIVFLALVAGMIVAFGVWQLTKYLQPAYSGALGWGVVVAKTCAGMLYPTMFFLLLSMARYFSTLLRRSYRVSRFINWDLSQEFHMYIAIFATFLGSLHGIAHLTGDFVWISNAYRPERLDALLGPPEVRELNTYADLAGSLPGITGIIALTCFYIIGLTSSTWLRRKNYEVFQLAHLLMYPIIACLMAHGTKRILQFPMLGYFLAFPTLLILIERTYRTFFSGLYRIDATIRVLDSETVEIKANIPGGKIFRYQPGQYVFLQVPELSFFQWHPFTISVCYDRYMQLNIKTDGNWTKKLRDLAQGDQETPVKIGIDGPYGAPAERFHDFSHSILVGAGIGVTPFSGILADLQARDNRVHGGPDDKQVGGVAGRDSAAPAPAPGPIADADVAGTMNEKSRADEQYRRESDGDSRTIADASSPVEPNEKEGKKRKPKRRGSSASNSLRRVASSASGLSRMRSGTRQRNPAPEEFADDYRRVDFHWIVRDKSHLGWFSDLLNSISRSQLWHHMNDHLPHPHLDIRIQTHVTQKRKEISTHVYRWLLELHRTESHPASPLTGLINSTHFGRPDFVRILDMHYDDMLRYRAQYGFDRDNDGDNDRFKVGVFFCGTPVVGEMIADRCRLLTARGRADGTRIEYYFMMEVFG